MSSSGPATSTLTDPGASPSGGGRPASFAELSARLEAGEIHRFIDGVWRRLGRSAAGEADRADAQEPTAGTDPAPGTDPAAGAGAEAPAWPDHQTQVGALLQAFAAMRLGAAARSLLEAQPPTGVDIGALDQQLAALPVGRLEWDRFDRTLEENHAALVAHHPVVAARLGDLVAVRERLSRLEPHRDAAGLVHVRRPRTSPDGAVGDWVGGFVDRRAERGFSAPRVGETPGRLVIVGVGTGRLVDRAVATTGTAAGAPPVHVHVIEPDFDALAAWLALADRRASLADPRLLLFAGPGAIEAWADCLARRPGLPLPDHVLVADPGADAPAVAQARTAAATSRAAGIRAATDRLAERWRGVSDAVAADRIRPGATIVGFTSRYTTMLKYAMRDVGAALESLGYRFVLVEEAAAGEHLFVGDIARVIEQEDAALVLTFNRLRPTEIPVFGDVPLLTLVLDPVDEILSREGGARVGPRDVLAGFYADRAVREFGYPARRYLPLDFFPVATRTFHDAPLSPEHAARFACDLVYVGHARGTAEDWHAHCTRTFEPAIGPLLDAARAGLQERVAAGEPFIHHPQCREIVDEACRRTGIDLHERVRSNVASMHVHRLHDIAWRRDALRWAARWATSTGRRLHLHGDGWADDPEFRMFARGPVAHDTEARMAYRGAKLALQLLPSGLPHQRTFEALASGALVVARESPNDFLLGDRHAFRRDHGDGADAPSILYRAGFRSLDELVFADEAEFAACMERWLTDDEARTARRTAMAAVVRERFTWDAVLPRILDGTRAVIGLV